ncbi:MAG: helix-turn-helix domain-containing protein [Betaproteobacteria bacterium]
MHLAEFGVREIARLLNRDHSTVSRELQRNRSPCLGRTLLHHVCSRRLGAATSNAVWSTERVLRRSLEPAPCEAQQDDGRNREHSRSETCGHGNCTTNCRPTRPECRIAEKVD